jgi:hypothetical protein
MGVEPMYFVTIVCRCGQHNSVHEQDLERAICSRCDAPLLRSSGSETASLADSAHVNKFVRTKPILAS